MASRSEKDRVLITGLHGFTGRHLGVALRKNGVDVVGLGCDIRDPEAVLERVRAAQPSVVVHLAGIANVAHTDARAIYDVNVLGSRNLFEAIGALSTPPRNTIVASSASVYGNTASSPIREDCPPTPRNDYGISKTAAEFLIQVRGDQLPHTIVRPFNYTGPGQTTDFVIPKIVDCFARRTNTLELGNTHVIREYGDVRRTVEAYVRLVHRTGDNKTYNIATGHGLSLSQVLSCCSSITGHLPDVVVNPDLVRANEVSKVVGSTEKIERYLGQLPRIGIEETISWMLECAARTESSDSVSQVD